METSEKKIKYGFGLSDTECFTNEFDTVDELIAFAQEAHDHPDGNYWDEDWEGPEYAHCIYIGVIKRITPTDYAPSLADIAEQMTDRFYCNHNIDDDQDVTFHPVKEAEEAWRTLVEKYFEMPCQVVCNNAVGIYNLQDHKWVVRYDKNN